MFLFFFGQRLIMCTDLDFRISHKGGNSHFTTGCCDIKHSKDFNRPIQEGTMWCLQNEKLSVFIILIKHLVCIENLYS